ncbi:MAG: ferredoxin--NADP reductase [bacterium]|nr:ferredoxin--NADP reductase [bacterium]
MKGEFHRLRVLDKRAETKDATSVSFQVPPPLTETFAWRPGQHLTLRFCLEGLETRRPYSISESPVGGGPLRVTVKRISGGLVSNHIHRNVAPGDVIEVMPPFGGFYLDPDARRRRTLYLFGAGSGITPLYSMLRSVLVAEPHSAVNLLYGNRDAASVIFGEGLSRLAENSTGRLTIRHVLSSPSLESSFRPWRRGRINAERVGEFIETHPPYAQDTRYYVCGPGDMNAVVRQALRGMDVPEERIHAENFLPVTPPDDSVPGVAAAMTVRLGGEALSVPAASGQTILEAVRASGGMAPYSCESGVCGACRARLRDGSVHLRARMALNDAEIARGVILTCQALPTTPQVAVDYD